MLRKLALALALCLAVCQVRAGSDEDEMIGLIDQVMKRDEATTVGGGIRRQLEVITPLQEVWGFEYKAAQIFCNYTISSGEDLPVTVTWRVGDGPRFAQELLKCYGYTHSSNRCRDIEVVDVSYYGRARIAQGTPSLEITSVRYTDNRNYWCTAALEENTDVELGFDAKSVVLRVVNGPNTPKFHSITVDEDIVVSAGQEVTINCQCNNGYHCDDVIWYKGPINGSYVDFELVYSRTSYTKPTPTRYQSYNQWQGRTHLLGNSVVIGDVTQDDAGRYWCEIRSSGYYAIGEHATDARSVVLEVRAAGSGHQEPFDCLDVIDGLYADPDQCNMYFECYNQAAYHRQCPIGTVFNPEAADPSLSCDFRSNVAPPCGVKIYS